MVDTHIVDGPLPPVSSIDAEGDTGAELIFHGRVRDEEGGRKIVALDYEAYAGMAETELQAVGDEAASKYPISDLICLHRVGAVPVGEITMRVTIRSAHRAEGLEAMAYFISELKKREPIWKWGVTAEGERFPSHLDVLAADDGRGRVHDKKTL